MHCSWQMNTRGWMEIFERDRRSYIHMPVGSIEFSWSNFRYRYTARDGIVSRQENTAEFRDPHTPALGYLWRPRAHIDVRGILSLAFLDATPLYSLKTTLLKPRSSRSLARSQYPRAVSRSLATTPADFLSSLAFVSVRALISGANFASLPASLNYNRETPGWSCRQSHWGRGPGLRRLDGRASAGGKPLGNGRGRGGCFDVGRGWIPRQLWDPSSILAKGPQSDSSS